MEENKHRKKPINFSNPFNGRKWLNLLKEDNRYGILFKENLSLDKDWLGFSFQSNKYGLRGSENILADNVVCGTSYAMGLSVDNGLNWYETLFESNYFNIGMPIGPRNHLNLLNDLYRGSYKNLIYLYHPNVFPIAKSYNEAYKRKNGIFQHLGWKTDLLSVLFLYIRWRLLFLIKFIKGDKPYIIHNNKKYFFNKNYNFFDYEKNQLYIKENIHILKDMFSLFENIYVIRVPIKEEIIFKEYSLPELAPLIENYDMIWNQFKSEIENNKNIEILENLETIFSLDDYLPMDTHWSEKGNAKFSSFLKKTINVF